MFAQEPKTAFDTVDAIDARLTKASALLLVLRAMKTSTISDEIFHHYIQTVQDLVREAQTLQGELWTRVLEDAQSEQS